MTAIRFEQRGCGRSTGGGPFTIEQPLDDLDRVRAAFGVPACAVLGHSWGAELALRHAARCPERTTAVVYIAGVGAGGGSRERFLAERERRLGDDAPRVRELSDRVRSADEERELRVLQWRTDFAPSPAAAEHAAALWATRPPEGAVNLRANRELWADRESTDLLQLAARIELPVTMILGAADPRPWSATDPLHEALPRVRRSSWMAPATHRGRSGPTTPGGPSWQR